MFDVIEFDIHSNLLLPSHMQAALGLVWSVLVWRAFQAAQMSQVWGVAGRPQESSV